MLSSAHFFTFTMGTWGVGENCRRELRPHRLVEEHIQRRISREVDSSRSGRRVSAVANSRSVPSQRWVVSASTTILFRLFISSLIHGIFYLFFARIMEADACHSILYLVYNEASFRLSLLAFWTCDRYRRFSSVSVL